MHSVKQENRHIIQTSKQYGEKKYPQNVGKNATNFSLMSIVLSINSENNITHVELLHKL